MDKGLIDGILHAFGKAAAAIGSTLRNVIDKPVINGFFGDGTGNADVEEHPLAWNGLADSDKRAQRAG